MTDPVIETDRLVLRPLTMADLDALAALYSDPAIRRYFPDGVRTYEQTREELQWIIDVRFRGSLFIGRVTRHEQTKQDPHKQKRSLMY